MELPPPHYCQTCHCRLEEDDAYCSVCGQKRIDHPLSVKEAIGDFLSNSIALDSKLFRTLGKLLFVPGSLTLAYWRGERKRHYSPFKLFLFWLTAFFLVFNLATNDMQKEGRRVDSNIAIWKYQQEIMPELYALVGDSSAVDSFFADKELALNLENSIVKFNKEGVSNKEIYTKNSDELLAEEQDAPFWKQLLQRQLIKAMQRPGDFQLYLLGHLSWVLLLSIPLMALWLKLLYRRQQPFYISHLIFTVHWMTFALLLTSLLLLWYTLAPTANMDTWWYKVLIVGCFAYLAISLYRCYQPSILKTALKFPLFLLGALLAFLLSLLAFLLLNFLLF